MKQLQKDRFADRRVSSSTRGIPLRKARLGASIAILALTLGSLGCESARRARNSAEPSSRGSAEVFPPSEVQLVVLVSIEGLSANDYQWLPAGGLREEEFSYAPNLVRLASQGVFADELVPVTPETLYPTHASLATGRHPNQHGVVADLLIGESGVESIPYWRADRLGGDTLWRAAKRAGLRVASLAWPSTIGADIDRLIPDRPPASLGETWIGALQSETSPQLWRRLVELAPVAPSVGWPSVVERDALLTQLACEMAADSGPPQLLLLRLSQLAAAQSRSSPGSVQARGALRSVDRELGRLLDCYRESGHAAATTFFVVGDRNLQPVHSLLRPNVILADAGLLTPPGKGKPGQVSSWSAIVRSNGRSGFVYARDEASAVLARKALRAEAERSQRFRVVSATELRSLEVDPQVWFGLEAGAGFRFQNDSVGKLEDVSTIRGAAGGLPGSGGRPLGFVAAGSRLRKGLRIPTVDQVDVAPTLARLLQLELEEADGREMIGLIQPARPDSLPEGLRRRTSDGIP